MNSLKTVTSVDRYLIFMNLFSFIFFPGPGVSQGPSDHRLVTGGWNIPFVQPRPTDGVRLLMLIFKGASRYTTPHC